MLNSHAVMSKHVKAYVRVFVALGLLTVLTALASRIDFHGDWNIVTALVIAAIKASLVAAVFMHLKWERSMWIWCSLGFCAIFFACLMVLPVLTTHDMPALTENRTWDVTAGPVEPEHPGETHAPGH